MNPLGDFRERKKVDWRESFRTFKYSARDTDFFVLGCHVWYTKNTKSNCNQLIIIKSYSEKKSINYCQYK